MSGGICGSGGDRSSSEESTILADSAILPSPISPLPSPFPPLPTAAAMRPCVNPSTVPAAVSAADRIAATPSPRARKSTVEVEATAAAADDVSEVVVVVLVSPIPNGVDEEDAAERVLVLVLGLLL